MKVTKDAALAAMTRFVREFGRYPSKSDYKEVDYLFSPSTSRRLIGNLRQLTLLEDLYKENPARCFECNVMLPLEKSTYKFCCKSCSAVFNNRDKKKPKSVRDGGCIKDCLHCAGELQTYSKKYCSLQCQQDHTTTLRILQWYSGEVFSNRVLRRLLEVLHGYRCSICNLTDWNNQSIVLEVEHIDGNSEDSSMKNVCLICPNCHSQTDTYKGKNKGKGRHKRRLRYQEGKSY